MRFRKLISGTCRVDTGEWLDSDEDSAWYAGLREAVQRCRDEDDTRHVAYEDFDAAERESRAALGVLPELADVARMRGRALLSPLLDKLIDGGAVGKSDFEGAYEAYRLGSIMNPDDSTEADEALGRIRDLCQKLEARDKDDLDEVIETTGKAVEEKALRFGRGARVVCNTGRKADAPWEAGTVVALYHREEGWAPGEVVP